MIPLGPTCGRVALLALVVAGCASRRVVEPAPSPDGSMTLETRIETSHADPGAYLCVAFTIRDRGGRVLHEENTRASDRMRWTMTWDGNDSVLLKSSDIGTYRWNRQADGRWTKSPAP